MGRMIDTDAAYAVLTDFYHHSTDTQHAALREALGRVETVDAVPVVRCKDCKSFSHGYCRFHDAKFVRPDGYCYWGERKDGGDEKTD